MKHIKESELKELAEKAKLSIQHDCKGYRVVSNYGYNNNTYIFPNSGICPTATKKECYIFLAGWINGRYHLNKAQKELTEQKQ